MNREAGRVLELATFAGADLAARVPSCPDWDFAELVKHLGNIYNWAATVVEGRLLAPPGPDIPRRPGAMGSPEWMADRLDRLVTALREAPRDALIWNFGPDSPSSVDFWCRRLMHETAIHRVDAELVAGVPVSSLEPDVAADTVAELFALFRFTDVTDGGSGVAPLVSAPPDAGGVVPTVHLHATDVDGAEWTLDTAARTVTRRHAKGDVALRGTAWSLARWCWGRPVAGEIEVFGDLEAAEAWRSSFVR